MSIQTQALLVTVKDLSILALCCFAFFGAIHFFGIGAVLIAIMISVIVLYGYASYKINLLNLKVEQENEDARNI